MMEATLDRPVVEVAEDELYTREVEPRPTAACQLGELACDTCVNVGCPLLALREPEAPTFDGEDEPISDSDGPSVREQLFDDQVDFVVAEPPRTENSLDDTRPAAATDREMPRKADEVTFKPTPKTDSTPPRPEPQPETPREPEPFIAPKTTSPVIITSEKVSEPQSPPKTVERPSVSKPERVESTPPPAKHRIEVAPQPAVTAERVQVDATSDAPLETHRQVSPPQPPAKNLAPVAAPPEHTIPIEHDSSPTPKQTVAPDTVLVAKERDVTGVPVVTDDISNREIVVEAAPAEPSVESEAQTPRARVAQQATETEPKTTRLEDQRPVKPVEASDDDLVESQIELPPPPTNPESSKSTETSQLETLFDSDEEVLIDTPASEETYLAKNDFDVASELPEIQPEEPAITVLHEQSSEPAMDDTADSDTAPETEQLSEILVGEESEIFESETIREVVPDESSLQSEAEETIRPIDPIELPKNPQAIISEPPYEPGLESASGDLLADETDQSHEEPASKHEEFIDTLLKPDAALGAPDEALPEQEQPTVNDDDVQPSLAEEIDLIAEAPTTDDITEHDCLRGDQIAPSDTIGQMPNDANDEYSVEGLTDPEQQIAGSSQSGVETFIEQLLGKRACTLAS